MLVTDSPTALAYPWPTPPGALGQPVWTGSGFALDGARSAVLSYVSGTSGWTDELTAFHEATAGADHPIDRASRSEALRQLQLLGTAAPTILEVGCSSGYLLRMLHRRFPSGLVIGADYVRGPLDEFAGQVSDVPLLQFDLCRCPLPNDSVDAVIMLNVLEHIEDDVAALRQVHRILKPGGIAVLEVPAGPELFDIYDELLMHYRRYTMASLRTLAVQAGFGIARASHLGALLYPAFYLVKRWNKRYPPTSRTIQQQVVAGNIKRSRSGVLVDAALRAERFVDRVGFAWPWGIRCLLTVRKAD